MSTKKKKKGELVSLSFYTFTKKLKKKTKKTGFRDITNCC